MIAVVTLRWPAPNDPVSVVVPVNPDLSVVEQFKAIGVEVDKHYGKMMPAWSHWTWDGSMTPSWDRIQQQRAEKREAMVHG